VLACFGLFWGGSFRSFVREAGWIARWARWWCTFAEGEGRKEGFFFSSFQRLFSSNGGILGRGNKVSRCFVLSYFFSSGSIRLVWYGLA